MELARAEGLSLIRSKAASGFRGVNRNGKNRWAAHRPDGSYLANCGSAPEAALEVARFLPTSWTCGHREREDAVEEKATKHVVS